MVKKLKERFDVLRAFYPDIRRELNIKEVSRVLKLSYQPTYTYLKEFSEKDFLKHKRVGNVHLYSLNMLNEIVVKKVEGFEFERSLKVKGRFNKVLDNVRREPVLCCFLVKNKLFFVVSDEEFIVSVGSLSKGFPSVVVTIDEFRRMFFDNNDFIKEKVVLFGFEFYYYELIKFMRKVKWV